MSQQEKSPVPTFKLKSVPPSPTIQKYVETFGHRPSREALKFKTPTELDQIAELALKRNKPVQSWLQRPNQKLGTLLDNYYAQSNTSPATPTQEPAMSSETSDLGTTKPES